MAHYPDVSQFEPRESAYECGFFTAALQAAAGETSPLHTAEWVDQTADHYYIQYDGPNTAANHSGMGRVIWYAMLKDLGVHYEALNADHAEITQRFAQQETVCVTVDETSIFDLDIGRVPYSWTPTGTHIISLVGYEPASHAYQALDTANIGPSGLRSWPRRYDAYRLTIHLATAIIFPWLVQEPGKTCTIVSGDTLYEIAQKYHVSIGQLLEWNLASLDAAARARGLKDSNGGSLIFPGEVLRVG